MLYKRSYRATTTDLKTLYEMFCAYVQSPDLKSEAFSSLRVQNLVSYPNLLHKPACRYRQLMVLNAYRLVISNNQYAGDRRSASIIDRMHTVRFPKVLYK